MHHYYILSFVNGASLHHYSPLLAAQMSFLHPSGHNLQQESSKIMFAYSGTQFDWMLE